ncbi:MAG: LON peptidase substrate-binding domain-containing protein [Desulfobacterales bacterium]|jgi:Lon protease-like protein
MPFEDIIPIFPLGLVLLPGMNLPLHIFEDRYKLMINTCLADDRMFGIVYFSGKQFETKGCTARILNILKRYDDGRLDITTTGENRFSIKALFEDKPYVEARVEFFDDQPIENSELEPSQKMARSCIQLLKQINAMTAQYSDADFNDRLDPKAVSFLAAACDGFSYSEKQRFLEMTRTARRLQKTAGALEHLVHRLTITREIERIIGGNGNLPTSLKEGV